MWPLEEVKGNCPVWEGRVCAAHVSNFDFDENVMLLASMDGVVAFASLLHPSLMI